MEFLGRQEVFQANVSIKEKRAWSKRAWSLTHLLFPPHFSQAGAATGGELTNLNTCSVVWYQLSLTIHFQSFLLALSSSKTFIAISAGPF